MYPDDSGNFLSFLQFFLLFAVLGKDIIDDNLEWWFDSIQYGYWNCNNNRIIIDKNLIWTNWIGRFSLPMIKSIDYNSKLLIVKLTKVSRYK